MVRPLETKARSKLDEHLSQVIVKLNVHLAES